ncbi:MAG: helix-turn-helix transcriptional regulator [Ruminococcaceae bacterium]|nr:helix-turn-helix transcriptional regulator [Oscillospiraceae bacterium]
MSNEKKEKNTEITTMAHIIKELRKLHRLTQEQTADIIKVKRSTYAYYERNTTPTVENIKKLATLFDVSVHFLMFGKEDPRDFILILRDKDNPEIPKVSSLSEDERMLIGYYRLLNGQNKKKVYTEAKELNDKQL